MLFRILPLAIASALVVPSLVVSTNALAAPDAATDLDAVTVTATRTAIPVADSLFPVEVIDRAAIDRSQARSLPDLLRGRVGIDVGNSGGIGKLSTVFLRGAESDQVLVLVDGVRVGSASVGLVSFQDLPVDQIERIEIVRGPRSSLYGSEAIGGVIQIFTRRDTGAFVPRFRVGVGSHNLREASAGIGGGGERGWFGVDAAYQRTDGINSCRGRPGDPNVPGDFGAGCTVDEPDRDGYRNSSVNLRGGINLTDTLKLEGNALRADAYNEYDGSIFGGNEADNVQQVVGGKLLWSPSQRFNLTAQAGRSYDRADSTFDDHAGTSTPVGVFDTRRDTASVQTDVELSTGQLLTGGVDYQDDTIKSDTAFDVDQRDNTGVFVQYQGTFGAQQLQASLRSDDNEQFGEHTTGSVGWGMKLDGDYRLSATYATGFKAPTFNDLYFPFFGNPDLKPEKSKSLNVGIGRTTQAWSWTLNAYETRIDDLVSYDASIFLPNNIDKARIRGVELTVDTTLAGWDVATQISHADGRNRTTCAVDAFSCNFDNRLARRARDTARIDVDRAFDALRVGVTVNGAGHRFDDAANSVRLGGYATTDLRVEYAIDPQWTLQARASNVFDRDYETVDFYNQPGREYGLSVRWQGM